jgi:crossover junction endodeoxyribonuclease RuvC
MNILGVDPGLKSTGYGMIAVDSKSNHAIKFLEAGTIQTRQAELFQNKIKRIHQNLNDIISKHKPDFMVLEKLYAHYKHPTTACIMGHVRGAICLLCAQREIELVEHSVKRIRKALVGNGNATKEQTRRSVFNILKIDAAEFSLDASDALALALGYSFMKRAVF